MATIADSFFPQTLAIRIAPEIFTTFPDAKISFALIEVNVQSGKSVPKPQQNYLSDFKQRTVQSLNALGITPESYTTLGVCRSWDTVFDTFEEPEKRSTIHNLLKRASLEGEKVLQGKKADLGKVSNYVDLYNTVSLQTLTPMGSLNLSAIRGDIQLRFGNRGETFLGLGKHAIEEQVKPSHVVYADDETVLTWLWNYRDAAKACVPLESPKNGAGEWTPSYLLLFADQAMSGASGMDILTRPGDAEEAIHTAIQEMEHIGGKALIVDTLTADHSEITLDLSQMQTGIVANLG